MASVLRGETLTLPLLERRERMKKARRIRAEKRES